MKTKLFQVTIRAVKKDAVCLTIRAEDSWGAMKQARKEIFNACNHPKLRPLDRDGYELFVDVVEEVKFAGEQQ